MTPSLLQQLSSRTLGILSFFRCNLRGVDLCRFLPPPLSQFGLARVLGVNVLLISPPVLVVLETRI